jgi:hypothetical protein
VYFVDEIYSSAGRNKLIVNIELTKVKVTVVINLKWHNLSYPCCMLSSYTCLPMKMEETGCSETSAYKTQTPGNYPEESTQHSEQGESLKSVIHFIQSVDTFNVPVTTKHIP